MGRTVTMQDVARDVGVSAMTVSNVLNNRTSVGPDVRRRVLASIERLGYRVNVAARNLRSGRTGIIGLAVPEVDRPYTSQLTARIITAAQPFGLRVIVEQTGATREDELDAVAQSRLRVYDGLILAAVRVSASDIDRLRVSGPIVMLGERNAGHGIDHIGTPNVDGARAVTEHLVSLGLTRIALVGACPRWDTEPDTEYEAGRLRVQGYRAALESAGVPFRPELVIERSIWDIQSGVEAANDLFNAGTPFDAVFGLTDSLAFGVLRGLADLGLHVPDDVAVAWFDNVREAQFSIPRLTTVAPDHVQIATRAVHLLVDRIEGRRDGSGAVDLTADWTLEVRESTVGSATPSSVARRATRLAPRPLPSTAS